MCTCSSHKIRFFFIFQRTLILLLRLVEVMMTWNSIRMLRLVDLMGVGVGGVVMVKERREHAREKRNNLPLVDHQRRANKLA